MDATLKDSPASKVVASRYKDKGGLILIFFAYICSNLGSPIRTVGVMNDPFRDRRLPPLPQSASKTDLFNRLRISESTHKLLLVGLHLTLDSHALTHVSRVERSCGGSQRVELEL
jgi:hypothetical protein